MADARLSLLLRTVQDEVNHLAKHPLLRADERNLEVLRPLLSQKQYQDMVGNIHLIRSDRSIASLYPEKGWTGGEHSISFTRESFEQSSNNIWALSRTDADGNPRSIYIAQRVRDEDDKPISLLLVEIRLDSLSKWIRTSYSQEQDNLMVINHTGKIILQSRGNQIGKLIQEIENWDIVSSIVSSQSTTSVFTYRLEGKTYYAVYYVSPVSGSGYLEWIGADEINKRLERLQLILFITICLVVGFSAYVAHRFSRWIGQPIYRLVSATDSLLRGDFSIRVPIEGMDEIKLLEKKFNQMAGQMQTLIEREREYMQESLDQIVRSFYLAVEMKDPYTAGHTERVTAYALILYDYLDEKTRDQFSRDDLRYASLMHDIGKVAIPDQVLLKAGKLTNEEYKKMKQHSTIGANIVEQIASLAHVSPGVRHHHERWDGKGYPDQLKGEEISLFGRIIAVADTFDAMTTTRSYRKAMTFDQAYEEIVKCSGTQFDPKIVTVFQKAYQERHLKEKAQSIPRAMMEKATEQTKQVT
ncbi:HD domain-containing phosphohydrolase [Brevibacillus nitrificans]|uniref:HD domain-containing phosphohydrolase n=1 Tax=Brevibacillus nitrificans TaxID=651560 RepID=UPI002856DE0A|nr:HD domain-containing phosphohydrolase [Brevibacillus nitrificans]MDR7317487.1 HD-GYP domain-containing protein (c-di-GMP phosphodiesterase class II) [Brevibacillus nitrificans]